MDRQASQDRAVLQPKQERGTGVAGPDHERLSALSATLNAAPPVQRVAATPLPNRTGMPDRLKHGVEAMSGIAMDDVRVHRNSPEPAQLNAHAFAQGRDIHLAPGQEHHLPHEAWHVAQQAQGRVRPTMQMKAGVPVNDEEGLEHEADVMGAKANGATAQRAAISSPPAPFDAGGGGIVQRALTTAGAVTASAKNKKFSWANLRAGADKATTEKGRAHGLGVATTTGKELKTYVVWEPVDSKTGEATGMDANILGPDHKLGGEPQAGADKVWNERRVALSKAAGGKKYIAGHLLNNNLGGPGDDPRNLTAIPATANTSQSAKVEEQVKHLVNDEHYFVRYVVDIDYDKDNAGLKPYYASKITSTWCAVDDKGDDVPPTNRVTIAIPSPSSLGGGTKVGLDDDTRVLDMSGAGKAVVANTDIVLNNTGYIAIATKVQLTFIAEIQELRAELAKAAKTKITNETERQEHLKKIEELKVELAKTVEMLKDTQRELVETFNRIKASEKENQLLKAQLLEVNELFKLGKQKVIDLESELDKAKQTISQLQLDNSVLQVGYGAALDVAHNRGEVPDEQPDIQLFFNRGFLLLQHAQDNRQRLNALFEKAAEDNDKKK